MKQEKFTVERNDAGTNWKNVVLAELDTDEEAIAFIRGFLAHYPYGMHDFNLSIRRPNGWSHVPACAMSVKAIRAVSKSLNRKRPTY